MKVSIPRSTFKKFVHSEQKILIGDANFFIPPTRKDNDFPFKKYRENFLEPFISQCNSIFVHQSVFHEIFNSEIIEYIQNHEKITIVDETTLEDIPRTVFKTIEDAVANYTNYKPGNGKFDDEGEVKSISYAATFNIDFFITHDTTAITILENKDLYKFTKEVKAFTFYEIIYFLYKSDYNKDFLRNLYRFLYHSTKSQKKDNPTWNEFLMLCEKEYGDLF